MSVSFGDPSLGPPPSHPLSERELIAKCRERVASFDSIGRGNRQAGSAHTEGEAGPARRMVEGNAPGTRWTISAKGVVHTYEVGRNATLVFPDDEGIEVWDAGFRATFFRWDEITAFHYERPQP